MLGLLGFIGICVFAALYPTATAIIIAGVVVVMTVQHVQDRYGRK